MAPKCAFLHLCPLATFMSDNRWTDLLSLLLLHVLLIQSAGLLPGLLLGVCVDAIVYLVGAARLQAKRKPSVRLVSPAEKAVQTTPDARAKRVNAILRELSRPHRSSPSPSPPGSPMSWTTTRSRPTTRSSTRPPLPR